MPNLPASDGKNYSFPEGTTADVAMGFLKSKGLSLRSAGGGSPADAVESSMPPGNLPVGMGLTQSDVKSAQNWMGEKAAQGLSAIETSGNLIALTVAPGVSTPAKLGLAGLTPRMAKVANGLLAAASRTTAAAGTGGALNIGREGGAARGAAVQGGIQAGAEAISPLLGAIIRPLSSGAVRLAEKSPIGRAMLEKIGMAVTEQAGADALRIVDTVGKDIPPEVTGEGIRTMRTTFDSIIGPRQLGLYEVAKEASRTARVGLQDVTPLAKTVEDLLKGDQRVAGFLTPMTARDPMAVAVAQGARKATRSAGDIGERAAELAQMETKKTFYGQVQSASSPTVTPGQFSEVAGGIKAQASSVETFTEALRTQIQDILKLRKATIPGLIEVRSTASQIANDAAAPAEARLVAQRILGPWDTSAQKYALDTFIEKGLAPAGEHGIAAYRTAIKYYAEAQNITEQALYHLAKSQPYRLHEFVTPANPQSVDTLRSMAEKAKMPELIPQIQRQWMEKEVEKGLTGLRERTVEKYGAETVNRLFKEPEARKSFENLLSISDLYQRKIAAVGVGPATAADAVNAELAKRGLQMAGGVTLGGAYGYHKGGYAGAAIGALAGATAPGILIKISRNPTWSSGLIRALETIEKPNSVAAVGRILDQAMK
jgi:hypothetical protein